MLIIISSGCWRCRKWRRNEITNLVHRWLVLEHVESDSLGQRSALSYSDNITLSDVQKTRGAVDWYILVSLLETSVLRYILKVITTDDNGSLHFGGDNHCLQDTTTNWHVAGERAFLVDIWSLNSFLGCFESKTDTLVISHAILRLLSQQSFSADEDTILLLIGLLVLLGWCRRIKFQISAWM